MKGQHNAWPEEECVPVVLPAAFQEHLYCSPPRTLRSASCAPRSASSWEQLRPLRTAGRLPELAEASRLSSCTAPGAQCNCPGWRPALTEQTPYRPPSSQFWASDPDWRPETGLYCDSLSPPLRPDHRGWEMNQGDMTQTQNTNIKQKCETEILMKNGMGNNEKHKTWSNEQNEWNWNQLCRKNTWQRCKRRMLPCAERSDLPASTSRCRWVRSWRGVSLWRRATRSAARVSRGTAESPLRCSLAACAWHIYADNNNSGLGPEESHRQSDRIVYFNKDY